MAGLLSNVYGQGYIEVSQSIGVSHIHHAPMLMGGGAAFIDYDLDGYEDLYLTGGIDEDRLYRNNGDGTFSDVTNSAGIIGTDTVNTMGVVVGDLDNDGDKEIFITTWEGYHNLLFLNNGDGTFQDISLAAGIDDSVLSISATMGDVNRDGLLDIYVGNYVNLGIVAPNGFDYTCYANFLYINTGGNVFVESALAYGVADTGCALAVAFTDYDMEKDVDLYVANDFGEWVRPNALLNNSFPTPMYGDSTLPAGVNDSIFGMGIAIGDYDEDGDFDYYITNLGRNVLRQNQGNGTFLDYTDTAGVPNTFTDSTLLAVGWGTAFYDYDNDTYLDLIVSNGYIPADSFIANSPDNPNIFFRGLAGGSFQDVSDAIGFNDSTIGRGLAIGDFNYDGAMDVVIGIADADTSSLSHSLVYINTVQGNNWLKVSLQGVTTNRDAYGSLISLYAGGRKFIREVDGGSSHLSHSTSTAHFGLGNLNVVDSVRVDWLNGASDLISNVAANQQVHIIEDSLFFTIHYQNLQMCPGDSIFVGGAYQFAQGAYVDTSLSGSGYDSIVHSSLLITPSATNIIQSVICSGDSVYAEGGYQFVSGTYMDTLSGSICDSIVTTVVTVNSAIFNTLFDSICAGDLYQGTAYINDTVLIGSFISGNGCDSTVTTNLVVHQGSAGSLDTSICMGDLYLGVQYLVTTTITDTLANSFGCDSIMTTNIQVLAMDSLSSVVNICSGDSVNGIPITANTTFIDSLVNTDGCDSTVQLDVIVWPNYFFNSAVTVDWGDTVNGTILYSDTIVTENYSSVNGCDSIVQLTVTVGPPSNISNSVHENAMSLRCYPNPFSSTVMIDISLNISDIGRIVIYDVLGREVKEIFEGSMDKGDYSFIWNGAGNDGYSAPSGVYLCTLIMAKNQYSVTLIYL
ncbi:MAG: VCBS repeat-containing protein [Flavobacteriales bacterium]|nr:VCBS repeat-containing protein [Flavobacteriales bacterium]